MRRQCNEKNNDDRCYVKKMFLLDCGVFETIFLVFLMSLLVCCGQFYWKRRRLYKLAKDFPGPPALPLIGNALMFVGDTGDILGATMKLIRDYGSPMRAWLGHKLFIGIAEPEDLEVVLNSPWALEKEDLYKFSVPLMGKGLLSAPVHTWKKHRKMIAPTFNQKILNDFVEVFGEQAKILSAKLTEMCERGMFDIFDYVEQSTLAIICETAMGVKTDIKNNFGAKLNRAMEIMYLRMFQVWFHFDFVFNLFAIAKEEKQIIGDVHRLTKQVIQEKLIQYNEKLQSDTKVQEAQTEEVGFKRKNFLDLLLELTSDGSKLTETELKDEVNTFMIAGSDTSASVTSFVFVMLGMHPDVQQKVYEEAIEILGNDRIAGPDDLPRFKYLEMVIKETMRIFPVGPTLARKVTADISLGSRTIPGGASIFMCIIQMHRNEKYWPQPMKFIPERFEPDEVKKRHPYTYLPFSGGPRNCIGPRYGMMSAKTMISTVVRKFVIGTDYTTPEDVEIQANFVLKPVKGYSIHLKLRK